MVTTEFPWQIVFPLSRLRRLRERARVRVQPESTTLTSYPLPPERARKLCAQSGG